VNRHSQIVLSWLSAAILLVLWYVATQFGWVDQTALPSPKTMYDTVINLARDGYAGSTYFDHVAASVRRTFIGLFAGIAFGIPIGLLTGYYKTIDALLSPIFSFIRPIPPIAFIPLVILYFGIGEFPKVFLIGMAAFWYVVLNTANGVRSVPVDLIRAALNMGLTERQLLTHVIFPSALPYIMTGIKTATALSWAIVVAAELVAAQEGLGYMIMDASTFFRVPYVYIGIISIGMIGLILEIFTNVIEKRLLHWRGK
jgi:NitT/TauT family transport system permease protein